MQPATGLKHFVFEFDVDGAGERIHSSKYTLFLKGSAAERRIWRALHGRGQEGCILGWCDFLDGASTCTIALEDGSFQGVSSV